MLNSGLNRTSSEHASKGRQIKEFVRQKLALSDDATVLVTELQCSEPGCPPLETVIAILGLHGQKLQRKIHEPMLGIRIEHLQKVCDSLRPDLTATDESRTNKKESCDGEH